MAFKPAEIEDLDPRNFILVKGAKVHNLKNIDVAIPRNELVVITGVSGSGKSSLAFDTLFAEGQRMYVESLSSYARQFLGRMEKPDVEYIKGISPAIAIEQKVNTRNSRSTVGTTTEIYDYLKLLYARVGKTYSPISGDEVKKDNVADVVDYILDKGDGARMLILAPVMLSKERSLEEECNLLLQKGYSRIFADGETLQLEEAINDKAFKKKKLKSLSIVIDRVAVASDDEDLRQRISDSVQSAFYEGHGTCVVLEPGKSEKTYSDKFEKDGLTFEEPTANFFSFNNPFGACTTCEGFGSVLGLDPDLIIPDKSLSVFEGAIAPWKGEKMEEQWLKPLLKNGIHFNFPVHRPYEELSEKEKQLLWDGNSYFGGLTKFFQYLESQTHKIQYRVMLSRYRGKTTCPDCKGTRIRKDAGYVLVGKTAIQDVVLMPVSKTVEHFRNIKLTEFESKVADRLLVEIINRLEYLNKVGLGYLNLNRLTASLSGGEFQRIKLATSLGSALVGSMYILDEPSIGLHSRDTKRLIEVLLNLKALGNTVIVVEHDEEVMRAADQIIDIGPLAGSGGGELTYQGTLKDLIKHAERSFTADYLNGKEEITAPKKYRQWSDYVEISGARENNLKNLTVKFPLRTLTAVTGVSGSGKSTLVKKVLVPAIQRTLGMGSDTQGRYDKLSGAYRKISRVEFVDQNPIGKSSRSNPVTYIKAFDHIRQLFSEQALSKSRGYKPGYFSFNVEGGRCETCQGEGMITVEMQFMADIHLTCEECKGQRYKQEVLEVLYNEKNIAEVLNLTVEEAVNFFVDKPKIAERLKPLLDVGLGYIKLGQSSNTLSGGEAQRVKLAYFISSEGASPQDHILFVFDEPTTGLHFHDIRKLIDSIQSLINHGHSVILIEHNLDVIKSADWVIDIGPDGGEQGGTIVFEGTPAGLAACQNGYTGQYLKEKIASK